MIESMEPTMDDKQQAEAALLAITEKIFEDELRRAQEDNPVIESVTRLFGVPARQATLAIRRAQGNVCDIMIKRGVITETTIITYNEVGEWAEQNLTYDQRLAILSFHVGSIVQLDWYYKRSPVDGTPLPGPEYMI